MRAIGLAAAQKISLPVARVIETDVDLGTKRGGHVLRTRLNVSQPGLECAVAQALVDAAHERASTPRAHAAT